MDSYPNSPLSSPLSAYRSDEEVSSKFRGMRVASPNGSPCGSPKTRKPYTTSKQRETWTPEEHQRFIEAIKLYKRDWKQIEKYVGSKNVIQIRSHAQKYFIKLQKLNDVEKIPPPRPKRPSPKSSPKIMRKSERNTSPLSPPKKINITQIHPQADFEIQSVPSVASSALDVSTSSSSTTTDVMSPTTNGFLSPVLKGNPKPFCNQMAMKQEDLDTAEQILLNLPPNWSLSESNSQNPVTNHPQVFAQWMALNTYLFGAIFPNYYQSSSSEIQKQMFELTKKAQQYVHQAVPFNSPPTQHTHFESFVPASQPQPYLSVDMNLNDIHIEDEKESKNIFPHVLDLSNRNDNVTDLNSSTLQSYYTFLGKQLEYMKGQVPNIEEPSKPRVESSLGDPNDIFGQFLNS